MSRWRIPNGCACVHPLGLRSQSGPRSCSAAGRGSSRGCRATRHRLVSPDADQPDRRSPPFGALSRGLRTRRSVLPAAFGGRPAPRRPDGRPDEEGAAALFLDVLARPMASDLGALLDRVRPELVCTRKPRSVPGLLRPPADFRRSPTASSPPHRPRLRAARPHARSSAGCSAISAPGPVGCAATGCSTSFPTACTRAPMRRLCPEFRSGRCRGASLVGPSRPGGAPCGGLSCT